MNAIEDNVFSDTWKSLSVPLVGVRGVIVISAHWLTRGTQVTAMEKPRTIHDFGGFPRALYEVEYAAPGAPGIADEIAAALQNVTPVAKDFGWGLDHGTWSILRHMYPAANMPVVQLSIDAGADATTYFRIGEALRPLRERGIVIIGSGNIVHNLRLVAWDRLSEPGFALPWAREADDLAQKLIRENKWDELVHYEKLPGSMQLAINSAEHYIPLLYIAGAALPGEYVSFFNAEAVGGALTMTSVRFGH